MYVRSTLKQVSLYNDRPPLRGWIVTFEIEVQNSPNFDLPVLVRAEGVEEKDLMAAAYRQLHEVVSSLTAVLPPAA